MSEYIFEIIYQIFLLKANLCFLEVGHALQDVIDIFHGKSFLFLALESSETVDYPSILMKSHLGPTVYREIYVLTVVSLEYVRWQFISLGNTGGV